MAFISTYQNLDDDSNNIEIPVSVGEDLLIDLIGARPWLFNKEDKGYSDQIMAYNAWRDISSIMNDTPENCKSRWSKILEHYHKEKLLRDKETRSGSGAPRRPWPFIDRIRSMLQKNTNQFSHSYSNVPSSSRKPQLPRKCFSETKLNKKSSSNRTDFTNSLFNSCNATISNIDRKINAEPQENKLVDSEDLFGLLIEAELNKMDSKAAKRKRKELLKYLCEVDSD